MDRDPYGSRPPERRLGHGHTAPPQPFPPSSASSTNFPPPTAQPPTQMPFSDPFQTNRDPFYPGGSRRGSAGPRAWTPGQGGQHPLQQDSQALHTSSLSASNAMTMPPPYDPSRRRSLGNAGSPQYGPPLDPPSLPPPFAARTMPLPSSPQHAPPSAHFSSVPRGPPTASPFPGRRDLASSSHHRPEMSISAILGGGSARRSPGSPHGSAVGHSSTPRAMQPSSPGRARSSSMRESGDRGTRAVRSPPGAGLYGEASRMSSEIRRDGVFGSPQFRPESNHSLRAFQPHSQDHGQQLNGHAPPARPSSQPIADAERFRSPGDVARRVPPFEARSGGFGYMGDSGPAPPPPPRSETAYRSHERPLERPFDRQLDRQFDRPSFHNGITSHPQERPMCNDLQTDRDRFERDRQERDRQERERVDRERIERERIDRERGVQAHMRYHPDGLYAAPGRDELGVPARAAFPPTSHPTGESPRESIEGRTHDMRRQLSHASPPRRDVPAYDRFRNGFMGRPVTLEEHHRMEALQRDQQRKESEGSVHKQILNISPEFSRRGRNSPLPQAVQGAQPRHVGPGGDNPGIKMEFGRMFSGLGSGVGSSTPNPGPQANGASTPSRNSPAPRPVDTVEHLRQADDARRRVRTASRAGSRAGKNGRRSRDEIDENEGRSTPDLQRGAKRAKGNQTHHHHHHVHPHHHHHHHQEAPDLNEGPNGAPRHTSKPLPHVTAAASQAHNHHHHAHPAGHHHHHPPRSMPPPRKPSLTVNSRKVLDACADKPRKHVGSQLYTTELSPAPTMGTPVDAKVKYSSKMKAIPVLSGYENCTYTVRVPRYYLTPFSVQHDNHSLEEICHRRLVYGTEIYTDDSDVVAAAVHAGWIKGDFGELNQELDQVDDSISPSGSDEQAPVHLSEKPPRPVKVPAGYDAHFTVLILPPLEVYAATNLNHIWSREWKQKHDGMSYMIHSIRFVDEGPAGRFAERGGAARKKRLMAEEAARREAAAGLLMFANGGRGNGDTIRVGA